MMYEFFFGKKSQSQRIVDKIAYEIECDICRDKWIKYMEATRSLQNRLWREGKTLFQFEEELFKDTGKKLERDFDYEGCLERAKERYLRKE